MHVITQRALPETVIAINMAYAVCDGILSLSRKIQMGMTYDTFW